MDKTVSESESINEIPSNESSQSNIEVVTTKDKKKNKPRTWTPAREEAWQKCLNGRKKFIETKKEIMEREEEEKSMKEKVRHEMMKKQLRDEIELELKQAKKVEESCYEEGEIEEKEEVIPTTNETPSVKEGKKTKVVEISESDSETISSESSREIIIKKRKKQPKKIKKKTKTKYIIQKSSRDTDSDESSDQEEVIRSAQRQQAQYQGYSYVGRYSFV
jgi:hypothetical protein